MAKSLGSTRSSASNNPRGLNAGEVVRIDGREMSHRDFLRQYSDAGELEPIAERLYRSGGLRVDPGDATYEDASALAATDSQVYGREPVGHIGFRYDGKRVTP